MQKSDFETSLTGYLLKEAAEMLSKQGLKIANVIVVSPVKAESAEYEEDYRVIKIRLADKNNVEVFVSKPF
ncbi:MAG: hypothetical protein WC677_02205 [Clostridia bacterium]